MYIFDTALMENEEILWKGKPHPTKRNKSFGGELFILIFCLAMLILMILTGAGIQEFVMYAVVLFFIGICVFNILKKLFTLLISTYNHLYHLTQEQGLLYKSYIE